MACLCRLLLASVSCGKTDKLREDWRLPGFGGYCSEVLIPVNQMMLNLSYEVGLAP